MKCKWHWNNYVEDISASKTHYIRSDFNLYDNQSRRIGTKTLLDKIRVKEWLRNAFVEMHFFVVVDSFWYWTLVSISADFEFCEWAKKWMVNKKCAKYFTANLKFGIVCVFLFVLEGHKRRCRTGVWKKKNCEPLKKKRKWIWHEMRKIINKS